MGAHALTAGPAEAFVAIESAADAAAFRPELRRLYDYWAGIAPPGRLPGRIHFDPLDIPSLLPMLWLLEVHRAPLRFRYRLVGTRFASLHGIDPTGRWLDEAFPEAPVGNFLTRLEFVVTRGVPAWRRGVALVGHGLDWQTLETLALPLASDGCTVDMVLGGTLRHQNEFTIP